MFGSRRRRRRRQVEARGGRLSLSIRQAGERFAHDVGREPASLEATSQSPPVGGRGPGRQLAGCRHLLRPAQLAEDALRDCAGNSARAQLRRDERLAASPCPSRDQGPGEGGIVEVAKPLEVLQRLLH